MKNKRMVVTTFFLSIVTVIGSMVLNFQEFLLGSQATLKNLIVTFTYIAIWITILTISIKVNIMKYIGH
jgi:hypothetical protein